MTRRIPPTLRVRLPSVTDGDARAILDRSRAYRRLNELRAKAAIAEGDTDVADALADVQRSRPTDPPEILVRKARRLAMYADRLVAHRRLRQYEELLVDEGIAAWKDDSDTE